MHAEEEAFQRRLDTHPDDHACRLVFADWLDDRGDERAAGYRALGVNRMYPEQFNGYPDWLWHRDIPNIHSSFPHDWFALVGGERYSAVWPLMENRLPRRDSEDAVARAFARLPEHRRAELLAVPVTA